MSLINSWQVCLILLLIFGVIYIQFFKYAVSGAKKDGASTVILEIISGLVLILFIPFFPLKLPADIRPYLLLFLASCFYALNDRLQTSVRRNLDVSVFSIMGQLFRVFLVLYGIFLFGEKIMLNQIIGAAMIFVGTALLFYKKKRFQLNKYVLFSVIASACLATALIIDVDISRGFNLPFYIIVTLIVPAIIISITGKISIKDLKFEFNTDRRKYYIIVGAAWALSMLFTIRSLQLGKVSLVAPLQTLSVLLNVILAYFLLKERENLLKKIILVCVITAGVFIILK